MTRAELITSLKREANNELKKNHCRLSKEANVQIQELITAGVGRMELKKGDNGSQIAVAQRNIRLICADMCKRTPKGKAVLVSKRMPGHGTLVVRGMSGHGTLVSRRESIHGTLKVKADLIISDRVFIEARLSICPLWPFC